MGGAGARTEARIVAVAVVPVGAATVVLATTLVLALALTLLLVLEHHAALPTLLASRLRLHSLTSCTESSSASALVPAPAPLWAS